MSNSAIEKLCDYGGVYSYYFHRTVEATGDGCFFELQDPNSAQNGHFGNGIWNDLRHGDGVCQGQRGPHLILNPLPDDFRAVIIYATLFAKRERYHEGVNP